MIKKTILIIFLFVNGIIFTAPLRAADTTCVRCAYGLIEVGDLRIQVKNQCGDPVSADTYEVSRRHRNRYRTAYVEEWVYELDPGYYTVMKFKGSRLFSIDTMIPKQELGPGNTGVKKREGWMLNKGYGAKIGDENFKVDAGSIFRCPKCGKIICESDANRLKIRCRSCKKWVFLFKK